MLRSPTRYLTLLATNGLLAAPVVAQPVDAAPEATPAVSEPTPPAPVAPEPAPAAPVPAPDTVRLDPHALVQIQAALLTGAKNQLERADRAEQPGFALRRGRLGLTGEYGRSAKLAVEADLARGADLLNEAWLSIGTWRGAEVVLGAHKVPFSRFAMLGSGDQALAERPKVVEALAPFRQVGFTLHGAYELAGLSWWAGGFNSFDRTPNFWQGVRENEGLRGNRNGGATVVARVQAEPFGKMDRAAADHAHEGLRLEVGGGGLMTEGGATREVAYSADAHLKVSGAHLLVEMLWSTSTPKQQPTAPGGLPAEVRRESLVAEAGYCWWRFNAAARVELVDPAKDVDDNRDEMVLSAALGYQLPQNRVRLQFQFDHRQERFGAQIDDDTLFMAAQVKL